MRLGLLSAMFALFGAAEVSAQMNQKEVGILQNLYGMETMERNDLGSRRVQLLRKLVDAYPAISAEELNEVIEGLVAAREEFLEYGAVRIAW